MSDDLGIARGVGEDPRVARVVSDDGRTSDEINPDIRVAPRDVRLANESWQALLTAEAAMMRGFAAERMWDELALTEYDVLYALARSGCALRQSELARHVLLSQPALSRLVERLVSRGLVARAPDPADGRASALTLTDAGAAAQQRVGARHARSVETRMRALTPTQQRQLRELCTLLTTDPEENP